jgi:hypothetical protein
MGVEEGGQQGCGNEMCGDKINPLQRGKEKHRWQRL